MRTFTIFDKHRKNPATGFVNLKRYEKPMLRSRYWLSDQGRLMHPLFRAKCLENMVGHVCAGIVVERPAMGSSFGIKMVLHWLRRVKDAAVPWMD